MMDVDPTDPTPHCDINVVLAQLLRHIQAILGDTLVGLYLYGSLAAGDFDTESSDVDFVAALSSEPDERELAALKAMHEDLAATGGHWGAKLEGAYLSTAALRRYNPHHRQPSISPPNTPFGVRALGTDWILNRHTLRERGVVVYGPPPATLIEPIMPDQLASAVRDTCREWRAYLDRPDIMRPRAYQAFTVLTMCRALCALESGRYVSKPEAAGWAMEHLAEEWVPQVRRALVWRPDWTPDDATLPETLGFLRFALDSVEMRSGAVQEA